MVGATARTNKEQIRDEIDEITAALEEKKRQLSQLKENTARSSRGDKKNWRAQAGKEARRQSDAAPLPTRPPKTPSVIPFAQVKGMLRERMRAAILQDKTVLRKMFQKYDTDMGGTIDAEEFMGLMGDLGVPLDEKQAKSFMKRLTGGKQAITFQEAFGNLLGLPHKFFEMSIGAPKLAPKKEEESESEDPRVKKVRKKMAHDIQFEKALALFVQKLREKWMNIKNSLNHIFRKQRGEDFFTADMLFNIFWDMGMGLSQLDLKEIMDHYDLDQDGKIHYYAFLTELLELPRMGPRQVPRGPRPPLQERCKGMIRKLRKECERAAARQSNLLRMFLAYDADGSGSVTYDEFSEIAEDLHVRIEGRNFPAELMRHFDKRGTGAISYDEFVHMVMGLEENLLSGPAPPKTPKVLPGRGVEQPIRPATPVLVAAAQAGIKERLMANKGAASKAFKCFDRHGKGTIRRPDMIHCLAELGIECTEKQAGKLFGELDRHSAGEVKISELTHAILDLDDIRGARQDTLGDLHESLAELKERDSAAMLKKLESRGKSGFGVGARDPPTTPGKVQSPWSAQPTERTQASEPSEWGQPDAHAIDDEALLGDSSQWAPPQSTSRSTSAGSGYASGDRFLQNRAGVHRKLLEEWLDNEHLGSTGKPKGNLVAKVSPREQPHSTTPEPEESPSVSAPFAASMRRLSDYDHAKLSGEANLVGNFDHGTQQLHPYEVLEMVQNHGYGHDDGNGTPINILGVHQENTDRRGYSPSITPTASARSRPRTGISRSSSAANSKTKRPPTALSRLAVGMQAGTVSRPATALRRSDSPNVNIATPGSRSSRRGGIPRSSTPGVATPGSNRKQATRPSTAMSQRHKDPLPHYGEQNKVPSKFQPFGATSRHRGEWERMKLSGEGNLMKEVREWSGGKRNAFDDEAGGALSVDKFKPEEASLLATRKAGAATSWPGKESPLLQNSSYDSLLKTRPAKTPLATNSQKPSKDLPLTFLTVPRGQGVQMDKQREAKEQADFQTSIRQSEEKAVFGGANWAGTEMWTPPYSKRVELATSN